MSHSSTQRLIDSLEAAAVVMGPDTSIRQLLALLYIAQAGAAGIDGGTLQKHTDSSQAATSRALKLFGPTLGLSEFFLDQNDGRIRLARLVPKGQRLVSQMTGELLR